jgi:asparagine synthetase B (glutamine-hydrolysing)
MCGIAGVINFNGKLNHVDEKVDHFKKSLLHRGPDETGVYRDDNAITPGFRKDGQFYKI